MLSSHLIRLVEDHWNSIAAGTLRQIRHDDRLSHIAALPDGELLDRAREIVQHLSDWLSESREELLARRFVQIGKMRHDESVPLHELVLSYILVKDRMLAFVRDQGITQTAMELWAEEELEHSVGRFFDTMIYHLIRGYENVQEPAAARAGQ